MERVARHVAQASSLKAARCDWPPCSRAPEYHMRARHTGQVKYDFPALSINDSSAEKAPFQDIYHRRHLLPLITLFFTSTTTISICIWRFFLVVLLYSSEERDGYYEMYEAVFEGGSRTSALGYMSICELQVYLLLIPNVCSITKKEISSV